MPEFTYNTGSQLCDAMQSMFETGEGTIKLSEISRSAMLGFRDAIRTIVRLEEMDWSMAAHTHESPVGIYDPFFGFNEAESLLKTITVEMADLVTGYNKAIAVYQDRGRWESLKSTIMAQLSTNQRVMYIVSNSQMPLVQVTMILGQMGESLVPVQVSLLNESIRSLLKRDDLPQDLREALIGFLIEVRKQTPNQDIWGWGDDLFFRVMPRFKIHMRGAEMDQLCRGNDYLGTILVPSSDENTTIDINEVLRVHHNNPLAQAYPC